MKEIEAIPDLNVDEYDENVAAGFKAFKAIVLRQYESIKSLRKAGEAQEGDWLESRIVGLGEGYNEAIGAGATSKLDPKSAQAAKRADLGEKFKVLEAGYKAAGKTIDRETIFGEAKNLVLGDVAAKIADATKAKALEKRSTQHLNRPGGSRTSPASDVFADVAEAIERKYFGKK
jgi:hypothetical protein